MNDRQLAQQAKAQQQAARAIRLQNEKRQREVRNTIKTMINKRDQCMTSLPFIQPPAAPQMRRCGNEKTGHSGVSDSWWPDGWRVADH